MGHRLQASKSGMHDATQRAGAGLRGSVVVITSASSELGNGAARAFAKAGASLVLAARQSALLDRLAEECDALGGRALAVPTDISSEYEVEQVARQAVAIFGWIDIWVNNASAGPVGRFGEIPLADHVQVVANELMGTLFGSYVAYRQFLKQGAGTLINIASKPDKTGAPYRASSAAATHGVVGLSVSLREEVLQNAAIKDHIHICVVTPRRNPRGVIDAILRIAVNPIAEPAAGGAPGRRGPNVRKRERRKTPNVKRER